MDDVWGFSKMQTDVEGSQSALELFPLEEEFHDR